jgi:hypothetical protein
MKTSIATPAQALGRRRLDGKPFEPGRRWRYLESIWTLVGKWAKAKGYKYHPGSMVEGVGAT